LVLPSFTEFHSGLRGRFRSAHQFHRWLPSFTEFLVLVVVVVVVVERFRVLGSFFFFGGVSLAEAEKAKRPPLATPSVPRLGRNKRRTPPLPKRKETPTTRNTSRRWTFSLKKKKIKQTKKKRCNTVAKVPIQPDPIEKKR